MLKAGATRARATKRGRLRIYREFDPDHSYAIGVDVSEGKIRDVSNDLAAITSASTPDYSVAVVLDCDANETAAVYATLEPPREFAEKIMLLYRLYKKPVTVVEANGPGLAVIMKLEELGLDNFYMREVFDKVNQIWSHHKGFRTTQTTRATLISNLQESLRDEDGVTIFDRDVWDELRSFVFTQRGREEAAPGCKDDRVFALMLALWGRKSSWTPKPLAQRKTEKHPDAWVWKDLKRRARKQKEDDDADDSF